MSSSCHAGACQFIRCHTPTAWGEIIKALLNRVFAHNMMQVNGHTAKLPRVVVGRMKESLA